MDSFKAVRQRQRFEARQSVEEDLFQRVPLSKEEAKRLKQQRRAGGWAVPFFSHCDGG